MKIDVPRSNIVRPPLEIVRQAVFNILGQELEGWRVADLFAGSGIMGIEALSRGADSALFVERRADATTVITENLSKARVLDRARVITGNALDAARRMTGLGPFDVVFADPPFRMARNAPEQRRLLDLLSNLFTCGELVDDATVIMRVPSKGFFPDAPDGVALVDERTYGASRLLFFERAAKPETPGESAAGSTDGEADDEHAEESVG
jgi:16S rRNA (guanine(966)-N(2))-methyltransferase RsmD